MTARTIYVLGEYTKQARGAIYKIFGAKTLQYLCSILIALILSGCTYNGLSGSSVSGNCPAELNGLWIQNEQGTLSSDPGQGQNCGCRDGGRPDGNPLRCYTYFIDGKVVSGYLTSPSENNANNCANDFSLNSGQVTEFVSGLNNIVANNDIGDAFISSGGSVHFSYAIGNCHLQQNNAAVSGSGPATGSYFDIRYPGQVLIGRDIVCTSYALRGTTDEPTLYLAGDPSGGGKPQSQDPEACNNNRFTNLIEYAKTQ